MGKYTGVLLCSDFDGTLYNGKIIPEENIKAIKHFRENGGLFTVASGRNSDFLLPFFEGYSFGVPLINLNGAVWYDADSGKVVKDCFMKKVEWGKLERILEEIDDICRMAFVKKEGFIPVLPPKGEVVTREHLEDIYKFTVTVNGKDEEGRQAKQRIASIMGEDYAVARSYCNYVEVLDRKLTKAYATRELAKSVCADTLVCVGDYENDIEMVRDADIGYAVANAVDEVKAVADRVTVSVNDAAIARIIEEL